MRTWRQWFKDNFIRLGYVTLRVINFAVSTTTLGAIDASSWLAWRHRKHNIDMQIQGLQSLANANVERKSEDNAQGAQGQPLLRDARQDPEVAFLSERSRAVVEEEKEDLEEEAGWLNDEINQIPWFDLGRVDAVLNPFRIFVVLKSGTHEIPKNPNLTWTNRMKHGFVNLRSSMRYLAYFGAIVVMRGAHYFSDAASRVPSLADVYGTTGQGHDAMIRDDPASYNSHSSYARNRAWFGTIDSYETGGWPNAVEGILWGAIVWQVCGDVWAMIRNYRSHHLIIMNTALISSIPSKSVASDYSVGLENPTVDIVFYRNHWWEKLYYNVVKDSGEAPNLVVWGILLGTKFAHSFVKDFYEGFVQSFPSYALTPDPSWANPVAHQCYDHRTGVVLSCATRFMEDFNNKFNSGLRDQFPTVPFSFAFVLLAFGLYHQLERRRPNPAIAAGEREEAAADRGADQQQLTSVLPVPSLSVSGGTGASESSEPSAISLTSVSEPTVAPMSRQRVRHYSLPSDDHLLMSGLIPVQNVRQTNLSQAQNSTPPERSRSSSDRTDIARLRVAETETKAMLTTASATTSLVPPTTPTTGSGLSTLSANLRLS